MSKPTIHELEKILKEADQPIKIMSDGSVRADGRTRIGTCGDCESDVLCPIQDALRTFNGDDYYFGDFGCIHWKEKL